MSLLRIVVASLATAACTAAQDPVSATMPPPNQAVETHTPVPGRCFGDSPPEAIAKDARPRDLFATGTEVLWIAGSLIHRIDVATQRSSTLPATNLMIVRTADSRDVFGVDGQMNLWAVDLSSGQSRRVSRSSDSAWNTGPGKVSPAIITLFSAEYVLDSDYVYVAWYSNEPAHNFYSQGDHVRSIKGPHDIGLLTRIKRDGSSPPELLGAGPDKHFIISDEYAYWGSRWEGIKRRRLAVGTPNEMVWAAPDVPYSWPIGVSGGRLYFSVLNPGSPRTYSIESVPAAPAESDGGTSQPRVHTMSSQVSFADGILDGKCVYSGGPAGVIRANLEDGTVRQLIEGRPVPGDATVIGSRMLATDGRYLYWADNGGDRVVRWSR